MKRITRARRHNIDHVSQILNPVQKPRADFSQRNYRAMKQLQTVTQRKISETHSPKPLPFKMSRFRSVGSLVLKQNEENPQKAEPAQVEIRAVSNRPVAEFAAAEQTAVVERTVPQIYTKPEEKQIATLDQSSLQSQLSINFSPKKLPSSPIKPGVPAADSVRKQREEEELHCPTGVRILSPEEQKVSLDRLLEEKRVTIVAINKVPLASTTPSIVKMKKELEKKLSDLERSIEVFMRKRVYVKAE